MESYDSLEALKDAIRLYDGKTKAPAGQRSVCWKVRLYLQLYYDIEELTLSRHSYSSNLLTASHGPQSSPTPVPLTTRFARTSYAP